MNTEVNTARDPLTYAVIGAAIEVHRELGPGFLEAVYQEALAVEFRERNIPFQREVNIAIQYKNTTLSARYKADFICFDKIVVEVKAVEALGNHDTAQAINYMKATGLNKALLFNFQATRLQQKRLVY